MVDVLGWVAEAFRTAQSWTISAYNSLRGIPVIGEAAASPFRFLADEFAKLISYFNQFSTFVDGLVAQIAELATGTIEGIGDFLVSIDVVDLVNSAIGTITGPILETLNWLQRYVSQLAADMSRGFAAVEGLVMGWLESAAVSFFDGFELVTGSLTSIIVDAYVNTRDLVENWTRYVWGALGFAGDFLQDLAQNFELRIHEAIFGVAMTATDWFLQQLQSAAAVIVDIVRDAVDDVIDAILTALEDHMEKYAERLLALVEKFFEKI